MYMCLLFLCCCVLALHVVFGILSVGALFCVLLCLCWMMYYSGGCGLNFGVCLHVVCCFFLVDILVC